MLSMIFSFDDFEHNEDLFAEFATCYEVTIVKVRDI